MVNLIEYLGGYKEAKSVLFMMNTCRVECMGGCDGIVHKKDLEKALLECRKENGVFEVGDKFCYQNKYSEHDDLDGSEYKKLHTLDDLDFQCGWADQVIAKNIIRHATDDEIKAGKCLP